MSLQRLAFAVVLIGVITPLAAQHGAYWPQFRGPNRSNVSPETGLLPEWPAEGPPLVWKAANLGAGFSPVSVAEGRIYTLGYRDGQEFAIALDRGTGKEIWAVGLGAAREASAMQFLFQRQPIVDGERLYVFSGSAELFCLEVDAGQLLWKRNYRTEFGGRVSSFGWSDNPLLDGERLICTPGGKDATLVALNKRTGEVIWKAVIPEGDAAGHSPIVVADVGGIRQYVQLLARGLVGIDAKDGKFLWRYDSVANATANVAAPVVRDDHIFVTSYYGKGSALLKLTPVNGGITAEEVYRIKNFQNINGGVVRVGEHLYGSSGGFYGAPLNCLEFKTGKIAWTQKGDFTSVLAVEGRLLCRHNSGMMTLLEATPQEYKEKGRFMQPERSKLPAWTYPVLAGGRLYVRDQSVLFCYDLRADRPMALPGLKLPAGVTSSTPSTPPIVEPLPDAIYVPTPQDAVEKMLELAKVKKDDTVVDLGCGDGRIVVTAAQKYGCKAIGYDIDKECVQMSLANVKKGKVEDLVRIENQDLFKVDLSKVDVVCLYLLPALNVKLIPQLEKMKPGSRIVSYAFKMPGIKPDQVSAFISKENLVERNIYLWTVPLKKEELGK